MAVVKFMLAAALMIAMSAIPATTAYVFNVGGRDGWVQNPREAYNSWAPRMRFHVNDKLVFKYKKGEDSVWLVNQKDYDACNSRNPLQKMDDGESVFVLSRSGPFFFISGVPDRCKSGEKLVVVVMAPINKKPPTPPSMPPSTPPSTPSAPAPSTPKAPSPSPSAPVPSPVTGAPTPSPSSVTPSPVPVSNAPSPVSNTPTPSPVSPSPAPVSNEPTPSSVTPSLAPGSKAPTPSPEPVSKPPTPSSVTPSPSPVSVTPTPSTVSPPPVATPTTSPPGADVTSPPPGPSGSGQASSPETSKTNSSPVLTISWGLVVALFMGHAFLG